jgi:hypothetical protein
MLSNLAENKTVIDLSDVIRHSTHQSADTVVEPEARGPVGSGWG